MTVFLLLVVVVAHYATTSGRPKLTMDGELGSSTSVTSIELQRLSRSSHTDQADLEDVSRNCESGDYKGSPSRARELEPLVRMDGEECSSAMSKEEKNQSTMSCWKCKYNWRVFLPVACCCRGFVTSITSYRLMYNHRISR